MSSSFGEPVSIGTLPELGMDVGRGSSWGATDGNDQAGSGPVGSALIGVPCLRGKFCAGPQAPIIRLIEITINRKFFNLSAIATISTIQTNPGINKVNIEAYTDLDFSLSWCLWLNIWELRSITC